MEDVMVVYQNNNGISSEIKTVIDGLIIRFASTPTEGFGEGDILLEYMEPERVDASSNSFINNWKDTRDIYKVSKAKGVNTYGCYTWRFLTYIAIDRKLVMEAAVAKCNNHFCPI